MLDADYNTNHGNLEFPPLFMRLAWRYQGETRWAQLYKPSQDARDWDKPVCPPKHELAAIGLSGDKGFAYVACKTTARKDRWGCHNQTAIPSAGELGVKCKVVFDAGSEGESTLDGWLVNDGMGK